MILLSPSILLRVNSQTKNFGVEVNSAKKLKFTMGRRELENGQLAGEIIFFTRPTWPSFRRTLIPCGWKLEFVKISATIPQVSMPVFWSAFSATSTLEPIFMSFLFCPFIKFTTPFCSFSEGGSDFLLKIRVDTILRNILHSKISRLINQESPKLSFYFCSILRLMKK